MAATSEQVIAAGAVAAAYAASTVASIKATIDQFITDAQAELDAIDATITALRTARDIHATALANARAFDPAYVPLATQPAPVASAEPVAG